MGNASEVDYTILILKAIAEYIRYRSPEAKAKLISFTYKTLVIEFSGSFCNTCNIQSYFEDYIYELKRLTDCFTVEISQTKSLEMNKFEVKYEVLS